MGARVTDDLDQRRRIAEGLVEVRLLGPERERPGAQQLVRDPGQGVVPFGDDRLELGLGRRPQVRAGEAVESGSALDGLALGADVDLLAPVDLALRPFAADTGVAAEVGAVDVLDRQLLLFGEREEVERGPVQARFELGGDPRARQVEEAHIVRRCTQFVTESGRGLRAGIELREVEDGEREISHASSVSVSPDARSSVASHYSRKLAHSVTAI